MSTNHQLILARRPTGLLEDDDIGRRDAAVPEPGEGQALVKVRYLSIDPTIRTWMDDVAGYLPPIGLGDVVRGGGIGEVMSSTTDQFHPGDVVFGMTGWQEYVLSGRDEQEMRVIPPGVPPGAALSVFGVTGMTAYFGLLDVGKLVAGDTVVVSGAAGATGSVVGQIAKLKGAGKVVGIAGTAEKCTWIVDALGFDAAINYRSEDVSRALRTHCPQGIDLYFDNVGGEILDACLARLAMRGRVVLCGAISTYNDGDNPPGPRHYRNLITRRGRMEGFIILDYVDRFAEAQLEMAGWVADGSVAYAEHVIEGLDNAPAALNLLFSGGNRGKVIVKL